MSVRDLFNQLLKEKLTLSEGEWDELLNALGSLEPPKEQPMNLAQITEAIRQLQAQTGTLFRGLSTIQEVSQISDNAGLFNAGEFRSGNGAAPGDGFTGGRFGWPGFTYDGTTYFLVGVLNDTLQVGLSLADGKIYAAGGKVILSSDAIIIKADSGSYLVFQEGDGTEVANIFQDGAGNLQVDLADNSKAFTINDGNLIVNHGAGVDGAFTLGENNVLKAQLWWDASEANASIENYVNGGIVLVMKGGASTDFISLYDRTAGKARFRFVNDGSFHTLETASDPSFVDGEAIFYYLDTGKPRIRHKQGATEKEFTLVPGVIPMYGHGLGAVVAAGATNYICPYMDGLITGAERAMATTRGGVVKNLYYRLAGTQPATGSLVVTLRVNQVDTAVVITIPAGSTVATFSDTTHTASISAGDFVSVSIKNNATSNSAGVGFCVCEVEYDS